MAHIVGSSNGAPKGASFDCNGQTYETDGGEQLVPIEVSTGVAFHTDTVWAMRCPGCGGYIEFHTDRHGTTGSHVYPSSIT